MASYKIKFISKMVLNNKTKIWSRSTLFTKNYISKIIYVHNGLKFSKVLLKNEILKAGELSMTRKIPLHPKKKNKNK